MEYFITFITKVVKSFITKFGILQRMGSCAPDPLDLYYEFVNVFHEERGEGKVISGE